MFQDKIRYKKIFSVKGLKYTLLNLGNIEETVDDF